MTTFQKVVFAARPGQGKFDPDKTFKIVTQPLSTISNIKEGEILVKNIYLSLDPAMRSWMDEGPSYIEPVKVGDVFRGATVGEVVRSLNPKFVAGDKVRLLGGWSEYTVCDGRSVEKLIPGFPLSSWLGPLGMTGMTAYFGLLDVGDPMEGETVLISGAAGATGSMVGQIAKVRGCRVVGIAGTEEKCDWIKNELGFDECLNYKNPEFKSQFSKACPKGVDVYFDNVGGEILDLVLTKINKKGRIVICGAISQYNATNQERRGPKNYMNLLVKRARMEGFVVFDYSKEFGKAESQIGQWMKDGRIKYKEHIIEGIENAPKSLNHLFEGKNDGKLIIKLDSGYKEKTVANLSPMKAKL